jgi:hypothetical protein
VNYNNLRALQCRCEDESSLKEIVLENSHSAFHCIASHLTLSNLIETEQFSTAYLVFILEYITSRLGRETQRLKNQAATHILRNKKHDDVGIMTTEKRMEIILESQVLISSL